MKRAFTLIELLVVIAIIAILAAILFPVFAQAKLAAKQARALSQMRQLAMGAMMYASDHDDYFVPATMRSVVPGTPLIWTTGMQPYLKNKDMFELPDTSGAYANDWNERRHQPIGYNDATGYDPLSTAVDGAAGPGTEGFPTVVNFSQAGDAARIGIFAVTPNAPRGDTTTKHRGYVFNPYNGMNDPGGDYSKGLPMISDRDLVVEGDPNYPTSPTLAPGLLKPIYARYGANRNNRGRCPIVFADGHAKSYSAADLNVFGKIIWRFR